MRELRRVARGPVVVVTCDPEVSGRMWLPADYWPELAALDRSITPAACASTACAGLRVSARQPDGQREALRGVVTPPRPPARAGGRPPRSAPRGAWNSRRRQGAWALLQEATHEALPVVALRRAVDRGPAGHAGARVRQPGSDAGGGRARAPRGRRRHGRGVHGCRGGSADRDAAQALDRHDAGARAAVPASGRPDPRVAVRLRHQLVRRVGADDQVGPGALGRRRLHRLELVEQLLEQRRRLLLLAGPGGRRERAGRGDHQGLLLAAGRAVRGRRVPGHGADRRPRERPLRQQHGHQRPVPGHAVVQRGQRLRGQQRQPAVRVHQRQQRGLRGQRAEQAGRDLLHLPAGRDVRERVLRQRDGPGLPGRVRELPGRDLRQRGRAGLPVARQRAELLAGDAPRGLAVHRHPGLRDERHRELRRHRLAQHDLRHGHQEGVARRDDLRPGGRAGNPSTA